MKYVAPAKLHERRSIMIADLVSKAGAEDWHSVADCAMDLREIDAAIAVQSWYIGRPAPGGFMPNDGT